MNCSFCSGTGYQPEPYVSPLHKRLERYQNASECFGPNDETESVDADLNNNQIVCGNANRPACICLRSPHAYECGQCYQFFHGRLAKICPQHKYEIFLMDFQCCPYCAAPNSMIKIAKLTWEEICKFENAELPGGVDGL